MRGFRGRGGDAGGPDAAVEAPSAAVADPEVAAAAAGGEDSVTVVIDRSAGVGGPPAGEYRHLNHPAQPVPGVPGLPPSPHTHTEVLDAQVAGALADPGASTQVLSRGPVIGQAQSAAVVAAGAAAGPAAHGAPAAASPAPLVSRRVAAEIGMYTGAALVLVSIGGVVVRGWDAWDPGLRWAFAGLSTVALVAAGLFLRLPWSRPVSDERRRAVSALLTTGVAAATTGMVVVLGSAQGSSSADVGQAAAAVGVVLAMLVVNLISRTPVSEAGLLGALAWAAWVVVPPGPGTWAFLVGLGVVWAGLSVRWARGRRTSMVLGATLALVASVGMAAGPWALPTRAGLAAAAVLGLGTFLRGRANYWLALGSGAATALAASVAGDVVGPALALLVGGLATMVVSWIALRGASRR